MAGQETADEDLSDWESPVEVELEAPKYKQLAAWGGIVGGVVKWMGLGKDKKKWTQLAGHQGSFMAGESQTVLKKKLDSEKECYVKLQTDRLKAVIPEYKGEVEKDGEIFLQLEDLLSGFSSPCVMDVKMGCRTYHEVELKKARDAPVFRADIYKKMIDIDPSAPTEAEREKGGIAKARYLQWRDQRSSSVQLSFRIEGIRKSDGSSSKDFKNVNNREQVKEKLAFFIGSNKSALKNYISRLQEIRKLQEKSEFFSQHELVGSSLLFVHDEASSKVWMIDFGKTRALPPDVKTDHRTKWVEGNHEDEYLRGMDNLLSLLTDLDSET